jgi:hypothetical protein
MWGKSRVAGVLLLMRCVGFFGTRAGYTCRLADRTGAGPEKPVPQRAVESFIPPAQSPKKQIPKKGKADPANNRQLSILASRVFSLSGMKYHTTHKQVSGTISPETLKKTSYQRLRNERS